MMACPYWGVCGGCKLYDVSEADYWAHKMAPLKGFTLSDIKFQAKPQTRQRADLSVCKTQDTLEIGFHKFRSHDVVDLKSCLVLDPLIVNAFDPLRIFLKKLINQNTDYDLQLSVLYDHGGTPKLDAVLYGPIDWTTHKKELLCELSTIPQIGRFSWSIKRTTNSEILYAPEKIFAEFGGIKIEVSPGCFLQATKPAQDFMITQVLRLAKGSKKIADLYAGSGTFTFPLLGQKHEVYAAESDHNAVHTLKTHQKFWPKFTIEKRNLNTEALGMMELNQFDAVLLDPPRAGAQKQIDLISKSSLKKVIYVSCDPKSFLMDAQKLEKAGFELKQLIPIDQFLWTSHLELIACFTK